MTRKKFPACRIFGVAGLRRLNFFARPLLTTLHGCSNTCENYLDTYIYRLLEFLLLRPVSTMIPQL